MLSTLVVLNCCAVNADSVWTENLPTGPFAPVVIPKPPTPNWSWDTIPLSLHGAVKTREFTSKEVAHLSKYHMYTAEKVHIVELHDVFSQSMKIHAQTLRENKEKGYLTRKRLLS
jgi:hypothetical protein